MAGMQELEKMASDYERDRDGTSSLAAMPATAGAAAGSRWPPSAAYDSDDDSAAWPSSDDDKEVRSDAAAAAAAALTPLPALTGTPPLLCHARPFAHT